MENKDYKNEDIGRKYIQNMQNSQILKVKNSLLKLQIFFFMDLKDRELKDRKEKIKKEIEKLFNKLIIVFKDDIDKSEEHEWRK